MTPPYQLGAPLDQHTWAHVKTRTIFECCKWDVQSEDHCVLADFPLLLQESEWRRISELAERLSLETVSAERELLGRPELHKLLGLPRDVRKQLGRHGLPSAEAARVMRFDFHNTRDGWKISEVNSDVPGGFIEASGFTDLMVKNYPGTRTPPDPAGAYAEAVFDRVGPKALIAMVHATAYSDDRQVMQFLAQRIAARGPKVLMVSATHILWEKGHASVSSAFSNGPLDLLIRFSPAEWLPMMGERDAAYFKQSQTPISNPAAAILTQSKRFPLSWPFLSAKLPTWNSLLPQSRCPSDISPREYRDWVIKPALGRVGEDVALAGASSDQDLAHIYRAARWRSRSWIAQQRFEVIPVKSDRGIFYPCIGVFTVDGRAAGAYGRIARSPLIDHNAQDVAVLIAPQGGLA